MKRYWLVVCCAWLFCWLGVSSRALATPSDTAIAAARDHFEAATKAYTIGEYKRAVVEYKAAYEAMPDPAILYNIAQAYRLASEPAQALFFYRAYLRNQPTASNRRQIEERIAELEAQIDPNAPLPASGTVSPATTQAAVDASLQQPAPAQPRPIYKKGWFWGTIVGVVVVAGVGVGLGVGLTRGGAAPSTSLGNTKVFTLEVAR